MRALLSSLVDRFQAKFPPNRLVALAMAVLATPLAALGGWAAVWVPLHFPGLPHFTGGQATAFLITIVGGGLLSLVVAGYKFLDGWQKHEAHMSAQWLAGHEAAREHLQREHELKLRVLGMENPFHAREALDQFEGSPGPPPDTPAAAVSAAEPPSAAPPAPTPPEGERAPQEAGENVPPPPQGTPGAPFLPPTLPGGGS
jgi:hypothetical protein